MEPFNFNELPEVVRLLFEKVEHIQTLVLKLQPATEEDNDLLNVTEAAAFLKISIAALYNKVSRKEIPASKPGKRLYFNKSELRAWAKLGRKKTAQEIRIEANQYMKSHQRKHS
jgi:excisionase family DNA binding protein